MKRIIITFITVFSMCCLVACSSETTDDTAADSNNEVVVNNDDDDPVVTTEATPAPTKEPSSEVTDVAPTEEPITEATPEPTEEPSVGYEGIDMESDLPGEEWVETFVGIIEEPKIVVFSDETGRKEIFENDSVVKLDPDTDMIGVYLPKGYTRVNKSAGITEKEYGCELEYFVYFKLKSKETRDKGVQTAALYVEFAGEEIELSFVFVPQ